MTAIIIIIIITVILYLLFWSNKTESNGLTDTKDVKNRIEKIELRKTEERVYTDENGQYELIQKTREIPRRTYIKASLNGKYWGEIDEHYSNQFEHSKFFDFNIYEVYLKNITFLFEQDIEVDIEKLPKPLCAIVECDDKEYEINLHEPVFTDTELNRKLHQDEGGEVFGTIDAVVSGYILDFTKEVYFDKVYILTVSAPAYVSPIEENIISKTNTPTGKIEHRGNYKRTEYYYSDYKQTYWSEWKYTKPSKTTNNEGCFSSVIGLFVGIIGCAFLLMILPKMKIFLPFLITLFLLNLIPSRVFNWFFRITSIFLLLGFVASLFHFSNITTTRSYIPQPIVIETPQEQKTQMQPIIDTLDNTLLNDTIIKHFRVWQDYDGNQYEGTIWTKKSDFTNAQYFKKNLTLNSTSSQAYDEMIYRLKENDANNLNGVYQLFDSIRQEQNLSNIKFAELIVSFVQDIPYTIVVPDDCNPDLYEDKFIKEYLSSENTRCDGNEKFGINSPVEFLSNLNGDCDTRTLLLYTMFAHYGYDVALLSSEYYAHSIIGVNLPLSGISYQYQNQRYVLWETTAPNIKAGFLSKEISNLNYWRISLKSK